MCPLLSVKYLWCEKVFVGVALYLIVVCSTCGRLLVANGDKKSRRCAYCGTRLSLDKVKCVGSVETAGKAAEIVQLLKQEKS
jgi:DNA-directed RNA polymerase subunit RPC12/RpoP